MDADRDTCPLCGIESVDVGDKRESTSALDLGRQLAEAQRLSSPAGQLPAVAHLDRAAASLERAAEALDEERVDTDAIETADYLCEEVRELRRRVARMEADRG